MVLFAGTTSAQVTPAAGFTPPDDTPSLRVGMTMFTDFTYQQSPKISDADGNQVSLSQFQIGRTYLNFTGNVSHIVSYRITPDIARETNATPALSGSYIFRIKYTFAQFSLDDWITNSKGNWVRLGIQQTPWVDFEEGIYRYRFQGTVFSERENIGPGGPGGFLSSSDAGASFHYNFPSNYGDVHAGIYNGEKYNKAETNDQKSFQFRGSVRPFATMDPTLRGLRAHFFYDKDSYVVNAERTRLIAGLTYEHQYVNICYQYLDAHDQTTALGTPFDQEGKGYSIWATPKQGTGNVGWEGLLRYDHLIPDNRSIVVVPDPTGTNITYDSQARDRTIVGVAYWFPHTGGATAALLFDYDIQTFGPGVPGAGVPGANASQTTTKKIAVHGLFTF